MHRRIMDFPAPDDPPFIERASIFHRLRREKSPANFYLLLFKRDTLEPSHCSSLPLRFYSPFLLDTGDCCNDDAFYFLILGNFFSFLQNNRALRRYFFPPSLLERSCQPRGSNYNVGLNVN